MKSTGLMTFPNSGSAIFSWRPRYLFAISFSAIVGSSLFGCADSYGADIVPTTNVVTYADGRPAAKYRLDAEDAGVVLRHGDGPGECDYLGARDVWAWKDQGPYYMHYEL